MATVDLGPGDDATTRNEVCLVHTLHIVMCGPGLGLKPRLGLGLKGSGLANITSPALSPVKPEPSLILGSSPGFCHYMVH